MMYLTSSMRQSRNSQTATPPMHRVAISAQSPSGRLSPIMATLSPGSTPRATNPRPSCLTLS